MAANRRRRDLSIGNCSGSQLSACQEKNKNFKQHNKKCKIDHQNFWLRLQTDQVTMILEETEILKLVKLLEEGENCRLVSQENKVTICV